MSMNRFTLVAMLVAAALLSATAAADEPIATIHVNKALQYAMLTNPSAAAGDINSASAANFGPQRLLGRGALQVASQALFASGKPTSKILVVDIADSAVVPDSDYAVAALGLSTTAVLLVVPEPHLASELHRKAMAAVESHLSTEQVPAAVYFTHPSANLTSALAASSGAGSVLMAVLEDDAALTKAHSRMASASVPVVESVVGSTGRRMNRGAKRSSWRPHPTVAVVASLDTLGMFPSLATKGANAATLAVLIAAHRQVSKVAAAVNRHESSAATGRAKQAVFLLSGGARLSYFGTQQWLSSLEHGQLDSIEFALCLEDVVQGASTAEAGHPLYLHVSRKVPATAPQDNEAVANAVAFHTAMNASANRAGIGAIERVHRKINVSHHEMQWEHEAYAYRKIPAATLSAKPAPVPQFLRQSYTTAAVSRGALEQMARVTSLVAEAVLRFMYPTADEALIGTLLKQTAVPAVELESLTKGLEQRSRIFPHMSATEVDAVREMLNGPVDTNNQAYAVHTYNFTFTPTTPLPYAFYGQPGVVGSVVGRVNFHVALQTSVELMMTASIVGYLFALSVLNLGLSDAISQWVSLFSSN